MFAIFVQKSWLKTIGEIADLIVWEEAGEYVSLLSSSAMGNFPFVEAELVRKEATDKNNVFLPAKIPITFVSGIFNLTARGIPSKYGFRPPEKK